MCDMNTDVGVCYKTVLDNIRQWLMKTVDENAFIRILSEGLVKKRKKRKRKGMFLLPTGYHEEQKESPVVSPEVPVHFPTEPQ